MLIRLIGSQGSKIENGKRKIDSNSRIVNMEIEDIEIDFHDDCSRKLD